jgi:hypothetical protein
MAARQLKRSKADYRHEWLVLDTDTEHKAGPVVAASLYDDRWMVVEIYDERVPTDRRWTITVSDRETPLKVVLSGDGKFATRDAAFRQIGAPVPQKAEDAA